MFDLFQLVLAVACQRAACGVLWPSQPPTQATNALLTPAPTRQPCASAGAKAQTSPLRRDALAGGRASATNVDSGSSTLSRTSPSRRSLSPDPRLRSSAGNLGGTLSGTLGGTLRRGLSFSQGSPGRGAGGDSDDSDSDEYGDSDSEMDWQ